jgi:hypothetical protein
METLNVPTPTMFYTPMPLNSQDNAPLTDLRPSERDNADQQSRTFMESQFPSLVQATFAAETMAQNFNRLTPELTTTISAYTKSAESISEAASQFSAMIENVKQSLEVMPAVRPFLSKILDALTILYDIVMAFINKVFFMVPSLIVRLFQLFGVDTLLINQFVSKVVAFSCSTQTEKGPKIASPQGAIEFMNILTNGIGTLVTGKFPDMNQLKYVNETLRYKNGILSEVKSITDLALAFVRSVPDQIQIWISYVVPTKWWLDIFAPGTKYFEWIDEVNSLDSHDYTVKAAYSHPIQQQILRLHKIGQELLKDCTAHGTKVGQVYKLLETTFKKLDHLFKIVDISTLTRGTRRVPFTIYLYGKTGQGKSFLSTILPAVLAGCKPDEPNLTYSRNPNMKFWDGYTGQYAVKYDDFAAIDQSSAQPGEMGEIMTIVSNEQMRLDMASLEDKGEVFRSQVVIISSNLDYPTPTEVRDRSALYRRRHVFVEVRVKDRFKKQGKDEVDPALIPDDCSHWEFIEKDFFDTTRTYRTLNYQDFMTDCKMKHKEHILQQERASINYDRMITEANQNCWGEQITPVQDALVQSTANYIDSVTNQLQAIQRIQENPYLRRSYYEQAAPKPITPQGLASDFHLFMTANNALEQPSQRGLYSGVEGQKFYKALKQLDDEAEKPKWYEAMKTCLPIMGIVAGFVGIGFGIMKYTAKCKKDQELTTQRKDMAPAIQKALTVLQHPRVQLIDAEGRWERLYSGLKNITPWMVEFWDTEMDKHDVFRNISDKDVESIIDQVLRDPKVHRLMSAEGVYSGHHMKGGNKKTNIFHPRMVTPRPAKAEGSLNIKMADGTVIDYEDENGPVTKRMMQTSPEGCIDQNALEIAMHKVAPQIGRISVGGYGMVCIFVGGRCLLTPYHLFCDPEGKLRPQGTDITITIGPTTFRSSLQHASLYRIGNDSVLYQMDANLPTYKDMSKFFISNADLEYARCFPALLVTVDRTGVPMIFRVGDVTPNTEEWFYSANQKKDREMKAAGVVDLTKYDSKTDFCVSLHTAWSYTADTQPGMCGSPIVMLDKFIAKKIVGFHAAGTANQEAIGQVITSEMILDGMRYFGITLQPFHPPVDITNTDMGLIQAQGNFTRVGTLFKHPRINDMTKIIPSILHGKVYAIKTAPAVLNPMDPRSFLMEHSTPMRQGIEKYGNIMPVVDMTILGRAKDAVQSLMIGLEGCAQRKILTQYEALNGVHGDDFLPSMDMTTSAGYPYNQPEYQKQHGIKNVKGKEPFIQRNEAEEWIINDPQLQQRVDKRLKEAKIGRRVESLWLDSLKDERRDLEKILYGKTRVFTIPPVDFTIVCRELFGAFSSAFYHNRLKYFSAVGIDPMSTEWTQLYNKLSSNSMQGFAGDFSGWDGNLSPIFMDSVCDIINAWYADSEENQLARKVLFDEIIHTPQCAMNEVYYTHGGNPSGNPLTVIINTIMHMQYLMYSYFKNAPPEYSNLNSFLENVKAFIYGDDDLITVKPEVLTFWNPAIILQDLKELNLTYTNAHKTGPAEVKSLRELSFLKRGFRDDGRGFKLPTIEVQTITELTNWTRECATMTVEKASVDNLNDSLMFMYAYGKEQFDKHRNKILVELPLHLHQNLNDWGYYHTLWLSKTSGVKITSPQGDANQPTTASAPITTNKGEEMRTDENTRGVIIQTQRAEEISGPTLEPLAGKRLQTQCIGDPQWSLPNMVNRRVWVNTYSWPVTASVGTAIVTLRLPQDVITNFFQSAPFERFVYYRSSIVLEFEVTGMRQQMGRLKIFNVPFTDASIIANLQQINPTSYYGLNPLSLDPSSNTKAKLIVPYTNPRTFISINGPQVDPNLDFMGTTLAVVKSPLNAASCAGQAVDVVVWASFAEDAEFYIPINSNAVGRGYNREHREQLAKTARFASPQGGMVSSVNNITSYGPMDGTCIPQKLTADDFTGTLSGNKVDVGSAEAFDRAARTPNPINNIRKYIQNYANSRGSEMLTRLDLNPSNINEVFRDHFSTNVDEMSMKFLQCTPTWVADIPWPGASARGTSLYSGFIGPMCSLFQQGTTTQILITQGQKVPLTQWEFNSMHNAYWKGGMHLRFELVATAFHVGRLCLTLNYGAPPGSGAAGLRDATSQYLVEFELSNEKCVFDYDIPWVSDTPWKKMCRGPQSPDDPDIVGAWWRDYFLGSWDLSIIAQLQTVCNSPPDAVIIMSYSGSPDFVTYMPSNINQTFQQSITGSNEIPRLTSPQGDAGIDATPNPPDAPALIVPATKIAPQGHTTPRVGTHFGAQAPILHARELLRRYYADHVHTSYNYIVQSAIATTTNDNPYGFTPLFNTGSFLAGGALSYTIFDWIDVKPLSRASETVDANNRYLRQYVHPINYLGTQYRQWRGSLRYKAIFGKAKNGMDGSDISSSNSGVIFIPHAQFSLLFNVPSAVRPNLAAIAAQLTGQIMNGIYNSGGDTQPNLSRVGVNYANDLAGHGIVNYCEIEVPFTTIFNTLPTEQGLLTADISPDFLSVGALLMYSIVSIPYIATPGTFFIDRPLTLLKSVGDDFRFGQYMGIPNIYPSQAASTAASVLWPDTWVVSAPAHLQVRRGQDETKSSDEEFDKVEPESMTKSMLVRRLHKLAHPQGSFWSKTEQQPVSDYWDPTVKHKAYPPLDGYEPFSIGVLNLGIDDSKERLCDEIIHTLTSFKTETIFVGLGVLRALFGLEIKIITRVFSHKIQYKVHWSIPDLLSSSITCDTYDDIDIDWETIDHSLYESIYQLIVQGTSTWDQKLFQWRMEKLQLNFTPVPIDSMERPQIFHPTDPVRIKRTFNRPQSDSIKESKNVDLQYRLTTPQGERECINASAQYQNLKGIEPSTANIKAVIVDEWIKYNDDDTFTARSAMHEITQKINTARIFIKTTESGPPHLTMFKSLVTFNVDNCLFDKKQADGRGQRKKDSEEKAAFNMLEQLHNLTLKTGDVDEKPIIMTVPEYLEKYTPPTPTGACYQILYQEQHPDLRSAMKILFGEFPPKPSTKNIDEEHTYIQKNLGSKEFLDNGWGLYDIASNSCNEIFFTVESLQKLKDYLAVFGFTLHIKIWTHGFMANDLTKVQVKLRSSPTSKLSSYKQDYYSKKNKETNYDTHILSHIRGSIQSTIWNMLEHYGDGELDDFIPVPVQWE